jgi:hypothetical protein
MFCRVVYKGKPSVLNDLNPDELELETFKYQILSIESALEVDNLLILDESGQEIDSDENLIARFREVQSCSTSSLPAEFQCFDSSIVDREFSSRCSTQIFGMQEVIQPCWKFVDTGFRFCRACWQRCDPSLISTHVSGDSTIFELNSFVCDYQRAVAAGLCAPISDVDSEAIPPVRTVAEELYWKRRMFTCAREQTTSYSRRLRGGEESALQFESSVASSCHTVAQYEIQSHQEMARTVINYARVREIAQERYRGGAAKDVAVLHGLLQWFKCEFFQWCNKPSCVTPGCAGGVMEAEGVQRPTTEEVRIGMCLCPKQ